LRIDTGLSTQDGGALYAVYTVGGGWFGVGGGRNDRLMQGVWVVDFDSGRIYLGFSMIGW
jgi:hypothetical protein